ERGERKSTHHYDDIFVVTEGKATLVHWETVVNAKTDSDCGTQGSRIWNGRSQNLVHWTSFIFRLAPPHQLIIAGGTVFGAVVVTVKEARNCLSCRIAAE